jgi:hypothetical protein
MAKSSSRTVEFSSKPPKKTNQGQGKHSRPNHGRKKTRGQGK